MSREREAQAVQVNPALRADTASYNPTSLRQSCSDLREALLQLASMRSRLDDPVTQASDDGVAGALVDVRTARQHCERLSEVILQTVPQSSTDAEIRRSVLSLYLAKLDVDQITQHPMFATTILASDRSKSVPTMPPRRVIPWVPWLKR